MTVGSAVREARSMLWTLAGIALVLLVLGCATLLHGTAQQVGMSRTSPGAHVAVDNVPPGQTTDMANLTRKDPPVVNIVIPEAHPRKRHATPRAGSEAISVLLVSLVFR